jgi:hypothetical protein
MYFFNDGGREKSHFFVALFMVRSETGETVWPTHTKPGAESW